jgi:hypothetical protein
MQIGLVLVAVLISAVVLLLALQVDDWGRDLTTNVGWAAGDRVAVHEDHEVVPFQGRYHCSRDQPRVRTRTSC